MTRKNGKLAPTIFTTNGLDTDHLPSEVVETPQYAKDDKGRFISGNIGGGRPLGARSKLGDAFIDDVRDIWQEGGKAALRKVMQEEPASFVRVIAGLMPKDLLVDLKGEIEHVHSTTSLPVSATLDWIQSVLEAKPVRTTMKTPN